MRFGFLGVSLAGIAAAAPPGEPGLKIIARETFPTLIVETTEYVQSDRARVESRVVPAPPRASGKAFPDVHEQRSARITRCDRKKFIVLNYDDRTYMAGPVRMYPDRTQTFLASLASRQAATPKAPNLLIETITVQTGERKTAFGHSARRVITTRRQILLDPAGGTESETEVDGWYIDLETQPSCERSRAVKGRAVLLVRTTSPDVGRSPEVPAVTFRDVGAPERGYPIETKTTSRSMASTDNGTSGEQTYVTHRIVMQLSTEPLDPALFEIPAGFRPAGGRLAVFREQWTRAWETTRALVAALFGGK